MSYLTFHIIFNLPLLALLLWLGRRRLRREHWKWIGVVCAIVLAFTLPWDNWAVARGVWEFDESRVLFRILHLPIEEIVFFILEATAVCLVTIHFLPGRSLESGVRSLESGRESHAKSAKTQRKREEQERSRTSRDDIRE